MGKSARTDAEAFKALERRVRRLENRMGPWQVTVGRYGDLVATNLDTGVRTVIAYKQNQEQVTGEA